MSHAIMEKKATDKVHFFDISSKLPGKYQTWSPNTIKTRIALNYKQIPYTQTYVSYPDIAPILRELDVPEFTPEEYLFRHTLPAIVHTSVNKSSGPKASDKGALMDSLAIAYHLDKVFPDRPLFPNVGEGCENAVHAIRAAVYGHLGRMYVHSRKVIIPGIPDILDARAEDFFIRTRSQNGKIPSPREWGSQNPEEDWKAFEKDLKFLVPMLRGSPNSPNPGPYFLGKTFSYPDAELAAYFAWAYASNKKDWERIMKVAPEFQRHWDACEPLIFGQGEDREWGEFRVNHQAKM